MHLFRHFLIGTLILYLVIPEVDGWLFRRVFKGIGRGIKSIGKGIKNGIRKVGKTIEKIHCKIVYGLLCPTGVIPMPRDGPLSKGTRTNKCRVKKSNCKRSADDSMQNMVIYPFSDGFNDYDFNRDKQIEYEEFVFSVMSQFPLGDPEELREPFIWADANGDGKLDMDEFMGAPFMFAHYGSDIASAA